MKTKQLIFVLLFMSFSIFAQKSEIPDKVKSAFNKAYPNILKVKWDKENQNTYEAEFKQNNDAISVVFDSEGKILETEVSILISQLPKAIEPFILKNYKEYKISEAAKITDSKGVVTFEAEIKSGEKKKDLLFDSNGNIINKKENKQEEDKETDED